MVAFNEDYPFKVRFAKPAQLNAKPKQFDFVLK